MVSRCGVQSLMWRSLYTRGLLSVQIGLTDFTVEHCIAMKVVMILA